MKKIGFITMHRIQNYGSILQTYALQQKIKELGYDNEIIDYLFPVKQPRSLFSFIKFIIKFIIDICLGLPEYRQKKRFKNFYKENLLTTPITYTQKSILENPPIYDVYISGSDQVWNPTFIKNDTTFLLSFAPTNKQRFSYSSSFAINEIPELYRRTYATELLKFTNITVREKSGIKIVKDITGRDAQMVCDPTLLLDSKTWSLVAEKSKLSIKEKYILVYILSYMYNPYPEIFNLVNKVQKELGNLKVVYLLGKKNKLTKTESIQINDAGPNEFVSLFKNAEFVITTSFHGTAFSLIFGRPFYSVVKKIESTDGRMQSLLQAVDCTKSLIEYNSQSISERKVLLKQYCDSCKLEKFRIQSELILKNMLSSCID